MAVPVHDRLPPAVVAVLRCPVCGCRLEVVDRALTCARGHAFDVARQGHVDLRGPRGSHGAGDDAAMLVRRTAVLRAGLFDPLLDLLVSTVRDHLDPVGHGGVHGAGLIVDVGAGPGLHLARVLDALPDRYGLAVDVSRHAAQRAALTHERAGSIVADVWHGLPVADDSAAAVLDVFAPRHPEEFHRILRPDGALVLVTPQADHLAALAAPLGLTTVDPAKGRRLEDAFGETFSLVDRRPLRWAFDLDRPAAIEVAGMGPGGHHLTADELTRRAEVLPATVRVEAAVDVTLYRPRPATSGVGGDGEVQR